MSEHLFIKYLKRTLLPSYNTFTLLLFHLPGPAFINNRKALGGHQVKKVAVICFLHLWALAQWEPTFLYFRWFVYKTARTFTAPSKSFLKCSPIGRGSGRCRWWAGTTQLKFKWGELSNRGEPSPKRAQEGCDTGEPREVGLRSQDQAHEWVAGNSEKPKERCLLESRGLWKWYCRSSQIE